MNVAALTHVSWHQTDNIADAGTSLQYVSSTEAHCSRNVPHGINNWCRSIIRTVTAHVGGFVCFGRKQLTQTCVNRVGWLVVVAQTWVVATITATYFLFESSTQATPTAELAKHRHIFGSGWLATLDKTLHRLDSLYIGFDTCACAFRRVISSALGMIVVGILSLALCKWCRFELGRLYILLAIRWFRYSRASCGVRLSIVSTTSNHSSCVRSLIFILFALSQRLILFALVSSFSLGSAGARLYVYFLLIARWF